MRFQIVLLALLLPATVLASEPNPTPEVDSFIADRTACDHFRGEPTEGSSADQIERRAFVRNSIEIYCAGSDRRLAALKVRFKDDPGVLSRLEGYESSIEPGCECP